MGQTQLGFIKMIPKLIHHVWVGPNQLPDQEKKYIQSWKNLHSEYEFILWDNEKIKTLDINDQCARAIDNSEGLYACQADIYRYIIVNTYGGIYVDTDVECYRNINELIDNQLEFIGLRPHGGNWITNAFFGSAIQSDVLKSTISNITDRKHASKNPYGPVFLTNHVRSNFNYAKGEIHQLSSDRCKILNSDFWSTKNKNAYCRHYFKASWRKVTT